MHARSVVVILCLAFFFNVNGQGGNINHGRNSFCSNFESSCSECIRNSQCKWCAEENERHCFAIDEDISLSCKTVENPQVEYTIEEDEPLSNYMNGEKIPRASKIIQFRPQKFKLKLRPGQRLNISVTFRQVPDYPLDLYYLMDLSQSMAVHKKTLAKVGKELATTMRNLTSQFNIGFGSFVDKVLLPFADTSEEALKNPCTNGKECAPPFSFINNLALTADDKEFVNQVNEAQISANVDSPEGGFDALMQAIVCKKEIGWRDQVRKIIVLSTDAQFHGAGDGKLAGVIEPNDGKCHLYGGNKYLKYDEYDYPSVSHINEVAKEHGINIIFAVKEHENLYKDLAKFIDGASYATLSQEPESVINIIKNVYNSITGKVVIEKKFSTYDNLFSMRFFSDCSNKKSSTNSITCENVKEEETFKVTVEIELKECPQSKGERTAEVKFGTKEEHVTLDIEMLCDCDCESKTNLPQRGECKNRGVIQCGICKCNSGFYGDECECSKKSISSGDTTRCIPNDIPNAPICSGKGGCVCSRCKCLPDYHGTFCQWNYAKCRERNNAELCSDHGQCEAEKCVCEHDWQGEFCQDPHEKFCYAGDDSIACSGNGKCIRGKCSCDIKGDIVYTGEFCEDCQSCGSGKCVEFQPCVQCRQWQSGVFDELQCDANCTDFHYQNKDSLEGPIKDGARLCTFTDFETNCDFNFTYKYLSPGHYQIFAQREQTCYQVNVLAAVSGVVGTIVGLGILTLAIWKIATSIHDAREYSRFLNELDNQKWHANDNKIYVPPTTNIANPAYGK